MDIINRVGLEVEGGWNGTQYVPPFADLKLVADHSIDGNTLPTDRRLTTPHVGEAVSEPLEVAQIADWIGKYWPHDTNITCGYHIHVSFNNPLHYMLLTKKSYAVKLKKAMEALGRERGLAPDHYLWARLSGNNPFCNIDFDSSGQMNIKEKRVGMRLRYGFLNFALGIHGTMEFRALPTFDNVDDARAFTFHFLNTTEQFIQDEVKRLPQMTRTLTIVENFGKQSFLKTKGIA